MNPVRVERARLDWCTPNAWSSRSFRLWWNFPSGRWTVQSTLAGETVRRVLRDMLRSHGVSPFPLFPISTTGLLLMPGRQIPDEDQLPVAYRRPDMVRRRVVLRETLARFNAEGREHFRTLAQRNVARWQAQAEPRARGPMQLRVLPGDWGVVTGPVSYTHLTLPTICSV